MAAGVDVDSSEEDSDGMTPKSMCPGNCDDLLDKAKGMVGSITKNLEKIKADLAAEAIEDDDDDVWVDDSYEDDDF